MEMDLRCSLPIAVTIHLITLRAAKQTSKV